MSERSTASGREASQPSPCEASHPPACEAPHPSAGEPSQPPPAGRSDSGILERYARYEAGRDLPATYTDPGCLAALRSRQTRALIAPLVDAYRDRHWLTIGDGYYGADANHLIGLGLQVTASALSAEVLRTAQARGFITDWRVENVEALTLPDQAVDVAVSIETIQHCARPYLGLYEMVRVAREAVAVMTCIERRGYPLDSLRDAIRRRVRGEDGRAAVERYLYTGDVLYRIAPVEFVKLASALGLHAVALLEFHALLPGRFWNRQAVPSDPVHLAIRAADRVGRVLSAMRLLTAPLAWAVLFRRPPPCGTFDRLRALGYRIVTFASR